MKSILEEFARGNIPSELRTFKNDSHFGRTMKVLSDTEDRLLAALGDELTEVFKQFSAAQSEINPLSNIDRFIDGYRLGVLMTMEVFNYRDDLVVGGEVSE